jgi:hypothetical protein
METVEIRQNKKTLIPVLVILIIALFGMTYYIFLSGEFDNNTTIKLLYVILNFSLAYTIYILTRKFLKNEPVLKFNSTEIEINEKGQPIALLWSQVIDWKIERNEDGGTYYLLIVTADRKRKINISWLDKRPAEVEELLQTYGKKLQYSTAPNRAV